MNKDIKLSNIKGLLIFLVVFGHLIGNYKSNYNNLYLVIYSFHMPLFVLVSGYFAKNASVKKAVNFILLYLTFQPIYRCLLAFLNPQDGFNLKYEVPYYHLWYLVSMTVWYLLYIAVQKSPLKNVNKKILVIGCFIIGISSKFLSETVVGMIKTVDSNFYPYTFSYQRTLSFLPFFFLGVYLSKDKMQKVYQSLKAKKIVMILVTLAIYLYFLLDGPTNKEEILKGSFGVYEMQGSLQSIGSDVLIGYIIAIVMCYVLLNIISKKESLLTKWGDRSLPIFLFHTVFVMTSRKLGILKELNPWILLTILFVSSVLILSVLSSDLFIRLTYYLWHPIELADAVVRKAKGNQWKRINNQI